jgi:Domain of unknown function (DUF4360)
MFVKTALLALSSTSIAYGMPQMLDESTMSFDGAVAGPGSFPQVSSAGSGCPGGLTRIDVDNANQILNVFPSDRLDARQGPGAEPFTRQRNCIVTAQVSYPAGQQFTVIPSDWSGFAKLDGGVTGAVIETVYFSSNAGNTVSLFCFFE